MSYDVFLLDDSLFAVGVDDFQVVGDGFESAEDFLFDFAGEGEFLAVAELGLVDGIVCGLIGVKEVVGVHELDGFHCSPGIGEFHDLK